MQGDFVEMSIGEGIDAGELIGLLPGDQILGAREEPDRVFLYWRRESWSPEYVGEVRQALERLVPEPGRIEIRTSTLEARDWNERWVRSIRPVRIGRRFVIRQSWNENDLLRGALELVIDPKQAFGSGFHATTQLLVESLEDHIRGGEAVLDVGSGSGILAMAALRLGAASAIGLDNDPLAVECALENATLNSFGGQLEFRCAALGEPVPGRFDVVVANLDTRTIGANALALCDRVAAGGLLLVSGILLEDRAEAGEALTAAGARVAGARERGEWCALELRVAPWPASLPEGRG